MKIELLKKGDSKLKEFCKEVNDFDNKELYIDLINQMKEEGIKHYAYATAAPQFGINKRFILMINAVEKDVKNTEELKSFHSDYIVTPYFNPKITLMKGLQYYYEACISTGYMVGKVARPYYIEFDYQDINGDFHHRSAQDFEAIVFCHEIDHLDGIEFTDKAEDLSDAKNMENVIKIRNIHPREIISKDGDFDQSMQSEKFQTKVYKII